MKGTATYWIFVDGKRRGEMTTLVPLSYDQIRARIQDFAYRHNVNENLVSFIRAQNANDYAINGGTKKFIAGGKK